ncbi:MAG: coproporphyrinogen III oxidase [Hyphomicrobiaceae bacterium]|nr:coproporphyrinogen III oxidase [Hyphomicrobiaceae bacterium]
MRSATAPGPSPSSWMPASTAGNPDEAGFGVYIHWPFCASKCPYCDFNSHVRIGGIDEPRYLAAFRRELGTTRERIGPRTVTSVFIGGGTPSLMQPATVGGILDDIGRLWSLAPDAEVTLEANPSSVEARRFRGYRAAGVDRVSLGVQALRDPDLKALGRLHSVAEAKAAIAVASSTFARFSFDLIYARAGQSVAAWREELGEALELSGGHLSLYQLTIEEGTPFAALHAAGKLRVPDGDLASELYELTNALTAAHGLPAYEISNHAAPGQESRHNLLYWRYGEYAGIGPGAHGRLVAGHERLATVSERAPERWLAAVEQQGDGLLSAEPLSRQEQADEALLMGLRLAEGLDLGRLERIGSVLPGRGAIEELVARDQLAVLSDAGRRIRATPAGRMVLNELVLRLSASFESGSRRR